MTGHFWPLSVDVLRQAARSTHHRLHVGLVLQDFPRLRLSATKPERSQSRPTLSQSLDTSASDSCLQFIRFSIQPSSVGIEPGSCVRDSLCGSAGLLTSMSILLSRAVLLGKASMAVAKKRCGGSQGGVESCELR